uniref:t-SNARE coiled-coil homology domain-containing protein n=1 Tax=Angiostrongylus cantonensis TaxID=6313 RepID=A0A0K0DAD1_ANGCA
MDFDNNDDTVIRKIHENIEELERQVQHLDSFIGRLTESEQYREQFNELAHKAQMLSKETNQLMKQLVQLSNSNRTLRVHRERLQNEYIGVLNRLQRCQRRAAQTEKAGMRQIRYAAEQQDAESRRKMEEEAYDREKQLQRQRDVNQIFADLARIVHDQGDVVDSIEANVEHAQIHVEQASNNLQQAVYYNQKARQKKMLLFAFFMILVLIIGLTIYLAR